jgi:hypothetical protein
VGFRKFEVVLKSCFLIVLSFVRFHFVPHLTT